MLNLLVNWWMSDGFEDFKASSDKPYVPFIVGYVSFLFVIQPILFWKEFVVRVEARSFGSAIFRAIGAGIAISSLGVAFYRLGLKYPGSEMMFIGLGYILTLGIAIVSVWFPNIPVEEESGRLALETQKAEQVVPPKSDRAGG